jgi:RHS repeat-associated protein
MKGASESTTFTYDGEDVVRDEWTTRRRVITKYQNGPGIDNKLSFGAGPTRKYFLSDHLGSTNGLADNTGTLVSSAGYDSFGNQTGTLSNRYGFTGREYDDFTGLMYYRARMYDPVLGRFISEDPIGFEGGDVNFYGYVRNQPLVYRDSAGLYPGGDILSNPGFVSSAATALSAAGAAIGVAASSPAVVAGAGFAAGYAVGYYPGQWTANHPSNPFVNGPLNPFGTPYPGVRSLPPTISVTPTSAPYCKPRSRAVPFYRTPTTTWPQSEPDREGCAEEISDCTVQCATVAGNPNYPKLGGKDFEDCMKICVSERCGGDPKWKGYKNPPRKRRWKF